MIASLYARNIVGLLEDAKTHEHIADAEVCDSRTCVKSATDGSFSITTDDQKLHVVAHGYRGYSFDYNASKIHFLRPLHVKALYLTFWGANPKSKTFNNTLELLKKSEINSIIVDVKNEYGDLLYKSDLKKPLQYGAFQNRQVYNIENFISTLKKKDAYLIARIVVFKDERQAKNNPQYAIKKDGKIWRNHDNMAWVDPFDKRSWKYVLDIAEDAAKQGFDEINFDYIRFPAKEGIVLEKENNMQNRLQAIASFLAYAKKRLRPYGVFISVDIYGNVCWSKDDTGIGQTVENFANRIDYLCPMLYPSSFASGSFGHKYPSEYPYEVIYKSIKHMKKKIDPKRVRPWIQAFRDYSKRRKHYGHKEIKAQIQATLDLNANGWMLWSPSSKYKLSYFRSPHDNKMENRHQKRN